MSKTHVYKNDLDERKTWEMSSNPVQSDLDYSSQKCVWKVSKEL